MAKGTGQRRQIDLSIGEMRILDPLRDAILAGDEASRRRQPRQADKNPWGDEELRAMFASQLKKRSGIEVEPDQVMVLSGWTSNVLMSILNLVGVQVAPTMSTWTPFWFGYPMTAERAGLLALYAADMRTNGFQPDGRFVDWVQQPIGTVLLNDVQNPLGTVTRREAGCEVAEAVLARPEGTVLIEDQHYFYSRYPGNDFTSCAALVPDLWRENRYIGLASSRLAFGVQQYAVTFLWAPRARIRQLTEQGVLDAHRLTPGHAAATRVCLSATGEQFLERMVAAVRQNLEALKRFTKRFPRCKLITEVEGGTNAFLDISQASFGVSLFEALIGIYPDTRFCMDASTQCNVSLFPGSQFRWSGERWAVRLNLAGAKPEWFQEALDRLALIIG